MNKEVQKDRFLGVDWRETDETDRVPQRLL
jgi:hypothetical protein